MEVKKRGHRLGFVPTMGALHEGHLSLVSTALKENEAVVVSIFVNPTQFDKREDLEKYPKTLDADLEKLRQLNPEILVFIPQVEEMYDQKAEAHTFDFGGLEFEMEGKYRTGHFNGVATIVKKFFEIVLPDVAYFGEKDYQQLLIIKKLVALHHFPIRIKGCPIAREPHGLAMSSRNERLSTVIREKASLIYTTLVRAREMFTTQSAKAVIDAVTERFKDNTLFSLEYVQIADAETLIPIQQKADDKQYRIFIAVYADGIRLIDNIALN